MSSLYTFHSYDGDGAPVAMQAAQFPTDEAAVQFAERVLAEHLSATYVVVCEGDREVASRHRTRVE